MQSSLTSSSAVLLCCFVFCDLLAAAFSLAFWHAASTSDGLGAFGVAVELSQTCLPLNVTHKGAAVCVAAESAMLSAESAAFSSATTAPPSITTKTSAATTVKPRPEERIMRQSCGTGPHRATYESGKDRICPRFDSRCTQISCVPDVTTSWCPRRESNPDYKLRKLAFYPLNYESERKKCNTFRFIFVTVCDLLHPHGGRRLPRRSCGRCAIELEYCGCRYR